MKYGYYPGCYVQTRMLQYDLSARGVLGKLGIEIVEISDAPCCGPAVIKSVDQYMASGLSAHILALTKKLGLNAIVTLCPECFSSFTKINTSFKDDVKFAEEVNHMLASTAGLQYEGGVEVKHLLQVLYDRSDDLSENIVRKFNRLKAAVHPGCHFTRSSTSYYPDDPENPKMLDQLVENLGIESVYWPLKLWCCGAPTLSFDRDLSLKLAAKKLSSAKASGAECIVTACPYCQMQFDQNQSIIEKRLEEKFEVPTVLFTQLIGLGLGLSPEEVGLDMNRVSPDTILKFMK